MGRWLGFTIKQRIGSTRLEQLWRKGFPSYRELDRSAQRSSWHPIICYSGTLSVEGDMPFDTNQNCNSISFIWCVYGYIILLFVRDVKAHHRYMSPILQHCEVTYFIVAFMCAWCSREMARWDLHLHRSWHFRKKTLLVT